MMQDRMLSFKSKGEATLTAGSLQPLLEHYGITANQDWVAEIVTMTLRGMQIDEGSSIFHETANAIIEQFALENKIK